MLDYIKTAMQEMSYIYSYIPIISRMYLANAILSSRLDFVTHFLLTSMSNTLILSKECWPSWRESQLIRLNKHIITYVVV